MASSKDCKFFIKEKQIQTIKVERNISYPEARTFVCSKVVRQRDQTGFHFVGNPNKNLNYLMI
jgi:hypothetical protein